MGIFQWLFNHHMKSDENKKWEDLEKKLKNEKHPKEKEMVRLAINTIEDVLKTRNDKLKQDKKIKGLYSMYINLTNAKNIKDKVQILAEGRDVGWNSGWNSNLRKIFSELHGNNCKNKRNQNDEQENCETTLEKVDKIKYLLNHQSEDKKLDQQVVEIFEGGHKDDRILGELSEEEKSKFENHLNELKTQIAVNDLKDQISSLNNKSGSSDELNKSLKIIEGKHQDLANNKAFKDQDKEEINNKISRIKDKITAQAKIEKIANDFILKCRNVVECIHDHYSQKDEEALLNESKKISGETEGWNENIPKCKEAKEICEQTIQKIEHFRKDLDIYIKYANDAVKVVYAKIENPNVEYKNPTNSGGWTLRDSLEKGIYACKVKGDTSKTKFENALKLDQALVNFKEMEIVYECAPHSLPEKCKIFQDSLTYLKQDEVCKNSEALMSRIEKIENSVKFENLRRGVRERIEKLLHPGDDFPDINKYAIYSAALNELNNDIDKLQNMKQSTGLEFEIDLNIKKRLTEYENVVKLTGEVKQKLDQIQKMKDESLELVCQKINAVDNLLNEVEEKKLLGNIKTIILGIRNNLVDKNQKNVENLKQNLRNRFNDTTKIENMQNYKQNLSYIQEEIKTHQPLIEPNFLKDKIDEFSQNMSKLEAIIKEFNDFKSKIKSIKIKSITDEGSKIVYDMADKLMNPNDGKFWLYSLNNNNLWHEYVSLYDACLKKDLATLKGEQDIDKVKGWVKLNQRINKAIMLSLQIKWDKDYTDSLNLIRSSIVRSLENKISNLSKQQEEQYFEVAKELRSMYNLSIGFRINDNIYSKFISVQVEIIQPKLKSKFNNIIKEVESSNPQCKDILIKNLEKYVVNYANVWTKEELEQTYKKMEDDFKITLESNQYFEKANEKYWKVTNNEQAKEVYFEMAQKVREIWNKGLQVSDKVLKTIQHGQDVMVRSRLSYKEKEILKKYNNDTVIKMSVYNNINPNNILTKSEFEWASNQMDQNVKNTENVWNNQRSKYITELENGRNQLRSEDDKSIIDNCIYNLQNASIANITNEYNQGLNKLKELINAQLSENLAKLKDELKKIKDEVREVHKFAKGKNRDEFKEQLLKKLQSGIELCIKKDSQIDKDFKNQMTSWSKQLTIDGDHENIFWSVRQNRKKVSVVTYNYLMFVSSILDCALDYLKHVDDKKVHNLSGSIVHQIKSLFKSLEDKSKGNNIDGSDNPNKIKMVWDQLTKEYKIDMNNIDKYLVAKNQGGKSLKEQLSLIDALCLCSSVLYDDINSIQQGTKEYESQLNTILNGDREAHITLLGHYLSNTRTEGWYGRAGMSLGWTVALMVKELLNNKERSFIDRSIARSDYGSNSDEEINNKKMWEVNKSGEPVLSIHDIKQTWEGTCWFTSALLGLIEKNPGKILDCFPERTNEVDQDGNIKDSVKEITVRLYRVLAEFRAKDLGGEYEDTTRKRARPICPVLIKIPVMYVKFGSESKVCWANYLERAMSVYRTDRCVEVVLKDSLEKASQQNIDDVFTYRSVIDDRLWKNSYKGIWNATGGATDGIAYAAITGETAGAIESTERYDVLKELKKKFNRTNRAAQVDFKQWFDVDSLNGDKGSIMPGHAYAVSKITDDYVILLDPYDRQYKVSIEDFKKNVKSLKFGRVGKKNNQNN